MEKTFKENLNMWALATDENHILHRIDNVDYPTIRRTIVKAEDVDKYEEIANEDIPPYTKAEYDKKVAELVRERYGENEEFAIQRKIINAMMSPETVSEEGASNKALEEYQAYNLYVMDCKQRAKAPELYKQPEPEPLPEVEPENLPSENENGN